jgi:DUF4097 and DUF4098 domain-containing protein YvlB
LTTSRIILGLVTLVAVGSAACDVRVNDKGGVSLDISEGGRAEDESTQTYSLAKGGQIEVQTENANIHLVAAKGAGIEVQTQRYARAKTDEAARELLKQEFSTVEATPDRLVIRSVKKEGSDFRQRVRVSYRISVPAGGAVSIKNENGMVRFEKVDGSFVVRSTNSRIEGDGVSGGVDFETVNGSVMVAMNSVTRDVRIRTVNGGVVLILPLHATLNASVEASAVNGGVSIDDALPLKTTTKDRQRVAGTLGTGSGPRIELQTTNGGVRLDVRAGLR